MKRIFYDLITFIQQNNNEFTSRDLLQIMRNYGHSISASNVQYYLYSFLQLADRRHTSIRRKPIGNYTYRLYVIPNSELTKMQQRLTYMNHVPVWLQSGLQRTNPLTNTTVAPRTENGLDLLLF